MNTATFDKLLVAVLLLGFAGIMILFIHWGVSETHIGWTRDVCLALVGALLAMIKDDLARLSQNLGGNSNATKPGNGNPGSVLSLNS